MRVYYDEQLPLSTIRYALVVMTICYLPHILTTPWWLSILVGITVTYRLAGGYWNLYIPSLLIRLIITVGTIWLLSIYYKSFFSNVFFIGVLVAFYWLKLLELRQRRDVLVIILIGFYVIFSALILNTELWVFAYVIIAVFCILSLLLKVYVPTYPLDRLIKKILIYFCLILPVCTLMFLTFPRISTPLWMLSMPSKAGTGFREDLTPGSISDLQKDPSTVMRVHFNLNQKGQYKLYWNGLVLNQFDGQTWRNSNKNAYIYETLPFIEDPKNADYEILLEPHHKPWLFYLEVPQAGSPYLQYSNRTGLIRKDFKKITQRLIYKLNSKKRTYKPLQNTIRRQNLKIPEQSNPRLQNFAHQVRDQTNQNPVEITRIIQKKINQQPYWYTLTPVTINHTHQLDTFWFDTQKGYCEHYASAVAFIYRAAGIPARVVVGYVGGVWNPVGQYLNVRKMDAHAWVEYWLEEKGWQRFDPTRYIAKERIEDFLINGQNQNTNFGAYHLKSSWYERFTITLESYKYYAERWLLFYNQERQQQVLNQLGLHNIKKADLFQIWLIIVISFLFIAWLILKLKSNHHDPLKKEYQKLEQQFKLLGIETQPPQTIKQQIDVLKQKYPSIQDKADKFIQSYEKLRLCHFDSENTKNQDSREIRRLIKNFRLMIKKINHSIKSSNESF